MTLYACLGLPHIEQPTLRIDILTALGIELQTANDLMAKIKKDSEDETINLLKFEIDSATSLLDGLHPSKKSDTFWVQVGGQVIGKNIEGKKRLFLEAKAQTVQFTESRWYASDHILATGDVQLA